MENQDKPIIDVNEVDKAISKKLKKEGFKTKCLKDFEAKSSGINHTTLPLTNNLIPLSRETAAFKIAEILEDLENLPWYEKLVNERRRDFLRNCLVITLSAEKAGKITKTKAAYFAGVIKRKTALQERIKRYKERHYKHIT